MRGDLQEEFVELPEGRREEDERREEDVWREEGREREAEEDAGELRSA
jgi:hypothetical protein